MKTKIDHQRLKVVVALVGFGILAAVPVRAQTQTVKQNQSPVIQVEKSYHNDVSPVWRDMARVWPPAQDRHEHTTGLDPKNYDFVTSSIPSPILNFDGMAFGAGGSSVPPGTDGAVGLTQYVQTVNEAYEVFDKATGASLLGPISVSSLWSGFGGVCQTSGLGDPIVLYDDFAKRWLISQFAGSGVPTDACVAISTTSDATGTYNRYAFHLGANFFDRPRLGFWPDGYYMSVNVFNSAGSTFLGPQAFAFDRAKMLAGLPATFITPGITGGPSEPSLQPSDLDGVTAPPPGAGNPFVSFPGTGTYKVRLFHADFVTPGNTTFNLVGSPAAAGFIVLCPGTRVCVPQPGASGLDGLGERLMVRLAYRKFSDHESLVGNYVVSVNGVAGIRWFELRNVTNGPVTVYQEGTYQPDTTWRWTGSAAMDRAGNLALGFSASSATVFPSIRYTGRLVSDPLNTLPQGEATLIAGGGSQTGGPGWGPNSSMTVDPVDDCTFWYTNEYYATTSPGNWRTRIGNFKFKECTAAPTPTPTPSPAPSFPPCAFGTVALFSLTNFDNVAPPALPDGWTAMNAVGDAPTWVTSNMGSPIPVADSSPNSAFVAAPDTVSDNRLDSPTIQFIETKGLYVIFRHNFDLQSGVDGGVLEISFQDGPFEDVTAPGLGGFVTGGYNSTISTSSGSPLAGRAAWSGNSGGFIMTIVNMPGAAKNAPFKLRWRLGTDNSVSGAGWRVDSIDIRVCHFMGTPPPVTPTPTPEETPTPTPTASPTPSVSPAQALNISTRLRVETGDRVMIGGFVIAGSEPKKVVIRGLGPSLGKSGLSDVLADPTLELRGSDGALLMQDDDWQDDSAQAAQLTAVGLAPLDAKESGIVATLSPGAYTAIVVGKNQTAGLGLVEVYDADAAAASQLANISTRGFVQTGNNVMIGGFILGHGNENTAVAVRGIGPSLTQSGLSNVLADPTLELRDSNGALLSANDNWQDDSVAAAQLTAHGLAPQDPLESGIFATLSPGAFTAVLVGKNGGVGLGLVEVYNGLQAARLTVTADTRTRTLSPELLEIPKPKSQAPSNPQHPMSKSQKSSGDLSRSLEERVAAGFGY